MTTKFEPYRRNNCGFNSLPFVVDRFMINSFNNGRKYYKNMLVIGADVWNDLYYRTLRMTKNKRIKVDRTTMTAKIPHDCVKLLAVKVIDSCNHYQPLTYDSYKALPVHGTGCGCKSCGCTSDACGYLSGISYTTEDVLLGDTTYQRVIKTKVCPNGDLVQEITEPFIKRDETTGASAVVYRTLTERVASVTVKACGCVEDTPANLEKCYTCAGCPVICCPPACDDTTIYVPCNDRGYYKVDDDSCMIYLFETSSDYVEVSYIPSGEDSLTEIMIPEYCNEAMYAGLYRGSVRFRQAIPRNEKRAAQTDYQMEKQELYEYLNPIVAHEFMALQYYFPTW